MKVPKFIYKDRELTVKRCEVKSFDGENIECFIFSPKDLSGESPCLIYFHGGGFVLPAAGYHYKNAMRYAREVGCSVAFVNYRLAPKHHHPIFFEDCYSAMRYIYDNSEALMIDRDLLGIGGDSAGATLAVGVIMMAKDRRHPVRFSFQMLPYPFLDARNNSDSCKKYTDTPMWNSKLSARIAPMVKADRNKSDYLYFSPVEADRFDGFPPAYIETAEFDCLHDDGILYAEKLRGDGIDVTLNETASTMHGFDIMQKAGITRSAMNERIAFMKRYFKAKEIN